MIGHPFGLLGSGALSPASPMAPLLHVRRSTGRVALRAGLPSRGIDLGLFSVGPHEVAHLQRANALRIGIGPILWSAIKTIVLKHARPLSGNRRALLGLLHAIGQRMRRRPGSHAHQDRQRRSAPRCPAAPETLRLVATHTGDRPNRRIAMPSSTPSAIPKPMVTASSGESRITPLRPSILRSILAPSGSRYVRWTPIGPPVTGSVISATTARLAQCQRRA